MLWKSATFDGPPDLSMSVSNYWNALTRGDGNAALRFVLPEFRSRLANRLEPSLRSWQLENARAIRPDRFEIFVRVLVRTADGYQVQRVREWWQHDPDGWKVSLCSPPEDGDSESLHLLMSS